MFFSKLARLIAFAAIVTGLLIFLFAMLPLVAASYWRPDELARFGNLGKQLDWAIYAIVFAVALGTLAEISFSLRAYTRSARLREY